jgi:hypothetical protein
MNAAGSLGFGHPLDAMHAPLELEPTVCSLAFDQTDDFFEATQASRARTHNFHTPAVVLGVAGVHAKQISREQTRLVTTRPRTDLQQDVFLIQRIFGNQQSAEFRLQTLVLLSQTLQFFLG